MQQLVKTTGAFYQPKAVLADTSLSQFASTGIGAGYAEVVKYGLLGCQIFQLARKE